MATLYSDGINELLFSSCSKHNSDVKENIIKEICSQPENKFSEDIVKGA